MKRDVDLSREVGYRLLLNRSKRSPKSVAYLDETGSRTFFQLHEDCLRFARLMESVGVKKAEYIAFRGSAYFQLVAFYACSYLGAVSAQIASPSPSVEDLRLFSRLYLEADFLISESKGWKIVDLAELPSRRPASAPFLPKTQDGLRIVFSSGTSGNPKPMLVSYGVMLSRISDHEESLSRRDRLHSFFGSATMLGSYHLIHIVKSGDSWIEPKSAAWLAATLKAKKINALQASPLAAEGFMKDLQKLKIRPLKINRIYLTGGWISEELERTLADFYESGIVVDYGASEVGKVARRIGARSTPWEAGKVSKSVAVEIVGEDQQMVKAGDKGRVRINAPAMVDGYLLENSSNSFLDGYFYPGDSGSLSADGSLQIFGREGSVANLSGVKIDLEKIESFARDVLDLESPIAFAFKSKSGVMKLGLSFQGESGMDLDSLTSSLRMKFGRGAPQDFISVARVPLTPSGKPDRQALAAHLENQHD